MPGMSDHDLAVLREEQDLEYLRPEEYTILNAPEHYWGMEEDVTLLPPITTPLSAFHHYTHVNVHVGPDLWDWDCEEDVAGDLWEASTYDYEEED